MADRVRQGAVRRGNAALRKNHASEKIIYVLSSEPIVPEARRYEPPQAMPISCKRNDPFESDQKFYRSEKQSFAK